MNGLNLFLLKNWCRRLRKKYEEAYTTYAEKIWDSSWVKWKYGHNKLIWLLKGTYFNSLLFIFYESLQDQRCYDTNGPSRNIHDVKEIDKAER